MIRPQGRLLPKAADGTLVNDTSAAHIPLALQPGVQACIAAYQEGLGDALHSVYLRGSVARGGFVPSLSDLDTWALSHGGSASGPRVVTAPWQEASERLAAALPLVSQVELGHTPLVRLAQPDAGFARMLLATTGLCVFGPDHIPALGRFRPGPDTLGDARHVRKSVQELLDRPPADTADACRWICKAIVRAGLESTAHRHGQYTRDLYPCWALFAAFHPEQAACMHRVLGWAITPLTDPAALHAALVEVRSELLPLVAV